MTLACILFQVLLVAVVNASGTVINNLPCQYFQRGAYYYGSDPSAPHYNSSFADLCFRASVISAHKLQKAAFITAYGKSLVDSTTHIHFCGNVGCKQTAEKRCKKCQNIYYCTRQCQEEHWSEHQHICCVGVEKKDVKLQKYKQAEQCFKQAMLSELRYGFSNRIRGGYDDDINDYCMNPLAPGKRKKVFRLQVGCRQPNDSTFAESAYQLAMLWSRRQNKHEKATKLLTWAMNVTREDVKYSRILGGVRDEIQSEVHRKDTADKKEKQKMKEENVLFKGTMDIRKKCQLSDEKTAFHLTSRRTGQRMIMIVSTTGGNTTSC